MHKRLHTPNQALGRDSPECVLSCNVRRSRHILTHFSATVRSLRSAASTREGVPHLDMHYHRQAPRLDHVQPSIASQAAASFPCVPVFAPLDTTAGWVRARSTGYRCFQISNQCFRAGLLHLSFGSYGKDDYAPSSLSNLFPSHNDA